MNSGYLVVAVVALFLIIAFFFVGDKFWWKKTSVVPSNLLAINVISESEDEINFKGSVQKVDAACWSDSGHCNMQIGGATVIWGYNPSSSRRPEFPSAENRGKIIGINMENITELESFIGKEVEVLAKKIGYNSEKKAYDTFSIVENKKYYIR